MNNPFAAVHAVRAVRKAPAARRPFALLATLAVALPAAFVLPAEAHAQTVAGPYLGYHDDFDMGIGVFIEVPIPSYADGLSLTADLGIYFPGDLGGADVNYFEINGGALYRFDVDSDDVSPFALGGLNIARVSVDSDVNGVNGGGSNTDLGLNLGGGVTFLRSAVRPSVGLKIELSGGDGFVIFGALGFPLG
jgi:hypothetical protein